MNGKHFTTMLIAVVAGACLAVFGWAAGKTETKGEDKKVTIDFWHHYKEQSPENRVVNEVLLPLFQKENPSVTVKASFYDWGPLHEKILVSASSGQLPDVARSDIAWIPEFQKMNILVALDREMGDFKEVAARLLDGPMATAKVKGSYYGLALNTNTKILFYNKELLDKAGVTPPRTFDEFFAAAVKLTSKDEKGKQVWGYGEPDLRGWNVCPFIWSNGGDITDPQNLKASGYINGPRTVEIIQRLADLYRAGAMSGFNSGDIGLTDGYATGRYVMIIEGPWKFAELAQSYPDFTPSTGQMPSGTGGSAQVLGGEDIVMFTSAEKDAAWKLMKFMTEETTQIEMAKVNQIPVNRAAVESNAVKAIKDFGPFLVAIKNAKPRPPVSVWSEIDDVLRSEVTLAVTGKKDVKKAMDDAAVHIDALLKQQ